MQTDDIGKKTSYKYGLSAPMMSWVRLYYYSNLHMLSWKVLTILKVL